MANRLRAPGTPIDQKRNERISQPSLAGQAAEERMIHKQIALYARVSSTQQADAGTIESQLSALRERVAREGFALPPSMEFVDDG